MNQHDSIIDLTLLNDSVLCTECFSPVSVCFDDSLGSDHAALSIQWLPPFAPLPYIPTILLGFFIDNALMGILDQRLFITSHPRHFRY